MENQKWVYATGHGWRHGRKGAGKGHQWLRHIVDNKWCSGQQRRGNDGSARRRQMRPGGTRTKLRLRGRRSRHRRQSTGHEEIKRRGSVGQWGTVAPKWSMAGRGEEYWSGSGHRGRGGCLTERAQEGRGVGWLCDWRGANRVVDMKAKGVQFEAVRRAVGSWHRGPPQPNDETYPDMETRSYSRNSPPVPPLEQSRFALFCAVAG